MKNLVQKGHVGNKYSHLNRGLKSKVQPISSFSTYLRGKWHGCGATLDGSREALGQLCALKLYMVRQIKRHSEDLIFHMRQFA